MRVVQPLRVLGAALCVACANTAVGQDGAVAAGDGAFGDVVVRTDAGDDGSARPRYRVTQVPLPAPDPRAPRLLAPLSSTYTTHRRPMMRWVLPPGATGALVEICEDRACTRVEERLEVDGDHIQPSAELRPGTHFWRAAARDGRVVRAERSFTWMFRAPFRSAVSDQAVECISDFNGDGFGDVIVRVPVPETRDPQALVDDYYFIPGGLDGLVGERAIYVDRNARGYSPIPIGDVNGDGYVDMAIPSTAPEIQPARRYLATVRFGGAQGPMEGRDQHVVHAEIDSAWFGALGDLNYDGYADFSYQSIHLPQADAPNDRTINSVGSLYGSSGGVDGNRPQEAIRYEFDDPAFDLFTDVFPGTPPSQIADMDGDGTPDIALERTQLVARGFANVLLFAATSPFLLRNPLEFRLEPDVCSDVYITCDINGDALTDVIARAYSGSCYLGGPQTNQMYRGYLGGAGVRMRSASGALVAWAPGRRGPLCMRGFSGPVDRELILLESMNLRRVSWNGVSAPDVSLLANNMFSGSMSAVGDVNNDGHDDLLGRDGNWVEGGGRYTTRFGSQRIRLRDGSFAAMSEASIVGQHSQQ